MEYKLAISDTVEFKVAFTANDKGTQRPFSFNVSAARLTVTEYEQHRNADDNTVGQLLRTRLSGWSGQALVLDSAGQPAAYCVEALDVMIEVPGAARALYLGYLDACSTKEKEKNSRG